MSIGFSLARGSMLLMMTFLSLSGSQEIYSQQYESNTDKALNPGGSAAQLETSIAVNPANSDFVIAGAITDFSQSGSSAESIGWYLTTDGGISWSGSDLLPNDELTDNVNFADPSVAISRTNGLYIACLAKGASTEIRVYNGSFNDQGGINWTHNVVPASVPVDKPHLTVDNIPWSYYGGTRALAFVGAYNNLVYFWNFVTNPSIQISSSTGKNQGPNLQYGRTRQPLTQSFYSVLYCVWFHWDGDSRELKLRYSTNRGTSWSDESTPVNEIVVPNDAENFSPPFGVLKLGKKYIFDGENTNEYDNFIKVNSFPSMAIDNGESQYGSNIYIVWADNREGTMDIYATRGTVFFNPPNSNNVGNIQWSSPTRVSNTPAHAEWFPWCSVDPLTGFLYVTYLSNRDFPNKDKAHAYLAVSTDGGQSFAEQKISDDSSFQNPVSQAVQATLVGDYVGIAASNGTTWACWNDDRNDRSEHRIYADKILTKRLVTFKNVTSSPSFPQLGGSLVVDGVTIGSGGQFAIKYGQEPHIVRPAQEIINP